VPAIIDQPLTPGISTTITVQVTNITDRSLPVKVGTRPLAPLDPVVDESVRNRFDASRWLTPLMSDLVLAPNETQAVQLTALAEPEAGPGGHYALIIFRALTAEPETDSNSARFNPEVASMVIFNLPGQTNEQLELSLEQPPIWQIWRPEHFVFNLINRGNIHVLPSSVVIAKPIWGGREQSVQTNSHLVLPGTNSRFQADWPELEWGIYRLEHKTSYGTPLKDVAASSRWFVVPPPLWLQLIAVGLIGFGIRAAAQSYRRFDPFKRRRRRVASDDAGRTPAAVKAEELDYLSREPEASDFSRKRPRR
jgi:hypothetical protein